jgi:hypothetical protein
MGNAVGKPYKPKVDWSNRYGVGSKRGTVPKHSKLTKNVKPKLTPKELAAIAQQKLERRRAYDAEYKRQMRAKEKIQRLAVNMEGEFKKLTDPTRANPDVHINLPVPDVPDVKRAADSNGAENDAAAMKMLGDMRWVYNAVQGREKLLELIKSDDKQFAFMVKELIKFETAMKEKEKGSQGGNANQNFFVIIKGLADEDKVKKQSGLQGDMIGDKLTITLNPDGVPAAGQDDVIPDAKPNEPLDEETDVPQNDTAEEVKKEEELEW